jgi:hypothetical protein
VRWKRWAGHVYALEGTEMHYRVLLDKLKDCLGFRRKDNIKMDVKRYRRV